MGESQRSISLLEFLKTNYPSVSEWYETTRIEDFFLGNIVLSCLQYPDDDQSKFFFTANGLVWVVYSYKVFMHIYQQEPTKKFPFFVYLWNKISSPSILNLYSQYHQREWGDGSLSHDWAQTIMTELLYELIPGNDFFVLNNLVMQVMEKFEKVIDQLFKRRLIVEEYIPVGKVNRFLLGFSPVRILKVNKKMDYLSVDAMKEFLALQEAEEASVKKIKEQLQGIDFIFNFLDVLGNAFYVVYYEG